MNITQNLTSVNRTVGNNRAIRYIVIHYFGALGSAEQTCAFFKSVNRKASAHYFVDDSGVFQCVLDKDTAWHCGDGGAGAYKGKCTNSNSIGIEVRPYKVNAKSISAADKDWYFTEKTVENLAELVKSLMTAHNIDIDHVIRHYDVTAKVCPRPWLGDDTNTYYGKTGNQLWNEFKSRLEGETVEVKAIPAIINGTGTTLKAVNVNGENYVRLRDLSDADTADKLTVAWDGKNVIINTK